MTLVQPMNLATLLTDNENEAKNVIPERSPNSTEVILPRFLAIKKSNADLPTQFDQVNRQIIDHVLTAIPRKKQRFWSSDLIK